MKLWLTGGTVRDHILREPGRHDVDFSVEAASYAEMRDALVARGLKVWQERPQHVTLRGSLPREALPTFGDFLPLDMGVVDADFTLCRKEGMYTDGRHPDNVTPATVHVDLARRDFTVNAVAVDEHGLVLDPHGGLHDLKCHVLDTVGDPYDRFSEDSLRMLRAFRFTVTRKLQPSLRVLQVLDSHHMLVKLKVLPVERVQNEMHKAFKHDWLHAAQLLSYDMSGLGCMLREYFPKLWLKATLEAQ